MASVDLFGRPERDRRLGRQLPLPLGWRAGGLQPPALLIGESNAALVGSLTHWQSWSTPVALLSGPARCGKSLMALHVTAQVSEVALIDPATAIDETRLFHLCTAALADRSALLIVAECGWRPSLPDLATRIAAAQDFSVPDPDLELIAAVLERRLAEQRLHLPPDVSSYLARRMDRSFASIDLVSGALAVAALSNGRQISVPFVRHALQDAGLLSQSAAVGSAAA